MSDYEFVETDMADRTLAVTLNTKIPSIHCTAPFELKQRTCF